MSGAPRSLVVGASAGLGRALAERLAEKGHDVFLSASDGRALESLARDLALRHGVRSHWRAIDLAAPDLDPGALREAVLAEFGGLDNLFLIAGASDPEADRPGADDGFLARTLAVNLSGTVRLANAFVADFERADSGNLVGIGSVAAVRGRRRNIAYGAAKRGLEFYFEGLRHHLADTGCRVQFYRFGYLATRMTSGRKLPFPALDPAAGAEAVVRRLGTDCGVVTVPAWWWPITRVLQALPWPLYRKLDI